MAKRNVLIQLDTDPHPSTFDRIVALDSGADEVLSYGGVKPADVQDLVHGAIFTRGPHDLKHTAVFIGGQNVSDGEALLEEVQHHLLPEYGLRVSVLFDSNGSNTTAAAAVRAASHHCALNAARALVLGGTGPVGQRISLLLARQGAHVRIASRRKERADAVAERITSQVPDARLDTVETSDESGLIEAVEEQEIIFAAGAVGVLLLPKSVIARCSSPKALIDLNAVPPLGIEGVELQDQDVVRDGIHYYGALGVGGVKMKIHREAIARVFESNEHVLDAEEIYGIAQSIT